ncbi:MAG: HAD-IA family hydrolase [Anaerolineaceae bacterium]|nr:HAD-IA family hydrolase [Anaerolineaceae bacterium]MDD4043052.1 HAD-IA family hydrolase [Anaerolineaceae bacterium]MDD4576926.1 HAD-IA family hydrolase [Anaerolineaceae bacterium]
MPGDNRDKRALIFDFDGLILDTETAEVEIWHDLYSQVGLTFDMEAYQGVVGSSGARGFDPAQPLADLESETRSFEQIRKDFRQIAYRRCEELDVMEGVVDLISRAKAKGYLLGLGSSAATLWVKTHLTRLGLFDQFDTIVTSEDVEYAKPAPDIFLRVLENLDVLAINALVLEDSYNGVLAAHRAGIRAIVVPNPITKDQDFSLATAVVPSLVGFDPDEYF